MKKEEFLAKLKKNLSILEEKEIQDIVEEYEQHIDMKMKGGLSEEAAIQDFGDLRELTAGILEAYHVKADYQGEKKNLDFDKVKEESRKATEKATSAIGKGAGMIGKGIGMLGKGAGAAGKWGVRQGKKLLELIQKPFRYIKTTLKSSREKAKGKGLLGRLWLLFLGMCGALWKGCKWCLRLCWNAFWLCSGVMMAMLTLFLVFLFGMTLVLLYEGYPLVGVLLMIIGSGLACGAFTFLFVSFMIRKDVVPSDSEQNKQQTPPDEHMDKGVEDNWEYPEEQKNSSKQMVINEYQGESVEQKMINEYQVDTINQKVMNEYQEVLHHA